MIKKNSSLKILFFGMGSIGQRHVEIIQKNYKYEIYAFRSKRSSGEKFFGIKDIFDWKDVDVINPDIAFITNPTSEHVKTAIECAKRGFHLFIEKPLGSDVKQLSSLLSMVSKKEISTYVAYVLRFHPVVLELKKYLMRNKLLHMRVVSTSNLSQWKSNADSKKRYSRFKKMGGGVIYDLSHEIDTVQYLTQEIKSMKGQSSRRGKVTVDAEDYADTLIKTKKGPVSVHVNFLSQCVQRYIQIDGEKETLVGDLINFDISTHQNGKLLKVKKLKGTLENCYRMQIEYFLKNIGKKKMMNDVFEAADLFKKIYQYRSRVLSYA